MPTFGHVTLWTAYDPITADTMPGTGAMSQP